jgi:hypothetical protein
MHACLVVLLLKNVMCVCEGGSLCVLRACFFVFCAVLRSIWGLVCLFVRLLVCPFVRLFVRSFVAFACFAFGLCVAALRWFVVLEGLLDIV